MWVDCSRKTVCLSLNAVRVQFEEQANSEKETCLVSEVVSHPDVKSLGWSLEVYPSGDEDSDPGYATIYLQMDGEAVRTRSTQQFNGPSCFNSASKEEESHCYISILRCGASGKLER